MAQQVSLPNKWSPLPHQVPVFAAYERGIKRMILVFHRRAGKDSCCINLMAVAAMEKTMNCLYLFPTARQGRKALFEAIGKDGVRVIDQAVPPAIRKSMRQDEMMITLVNGSTIQIAGADNYDSLVGTNYQFVVFSEYALTSPTAWRFMSPILVENKGVAIFNSTPRGKNHLWQLLETNRDNPDWYCSVKGIRDTGLLTQGQVDDEIRAGMPREVADQEYHCSFTSQNVGAIFRREMDHLRELERIGDVPYDRRHPVETAWDTGHRDSTAIWFYQRVGAEIRVIDYYENRGRGLEHYVEELRKRGYTYSRHIGPHDLDNSIFAIDASTLDVAKNFGINFVVAPKLALDEGIAATRTFLGRCRFDKAKCADGIAALDAYERSYDEKDKQLSAKPVHNWSSHGSDALRYAAVTPEGVGLIPSWAKPIMLTTTTTWHQPMNTGPHAFNHNGGPALDEADPLSAYR
jgi:phage terminase large subunit